MSNRAHDKERKAALAKEDYEAFAGVSKRFLRIIKETTDATAQFLD